MQAFSSALASRVAHGGVLAGSGSGATASSSLSVCATFESLLAPPCGRRRRRRCQPIAAAHRSDQEVWLPTQETSIDSESSSITGDSSSRSWFQLLAAPAQLLPRALGASAAQLSSSGSTSSPGDGGSGSASAAMKEVDEVYENQRLFAVVWKPPLGALDWPEWSDARGNPVLLASPPSEDPGAWELVVTGATDDEGWCYATVFKHLEYKRAGGRSSARFGDTVRRRLWRRSKSSAAAAAALAVAVPAGPDEAALAAAGGAAAEAGVEAGTVAAATTAALEARAAREAEAKKKAIKAFLNLVLDLLSRRQVWTLVPWDPTAVFILARKHQQVYQELQAQAYERQLFTADQEAPPSQLHPGGTLLQDLLCAATHSRAAYGFALEAGFMADVASYIRLQTVQQLTFDAVGGVSAEANNESVAALAGIDPADLLMAEWRNSPYRPCHYVALDRANQCVVLSIRGSLQIGDLLSDLAAAPMEVTIGGADGWVHQGIFEAATYIHCSTQEALQEAARRCPGWPLLVTGHSLGGGVAALLTLLLQDTGTLPPEMGALRCITMGTAAVMSRPLAEACNDRVISVILGSDAIPHLSYASVEALLLEASEESPVRRTVEGWGRTVAGTVAGALNTTVTKQKELSDAAAAALTSGKIAGSWSAVREASTRLTKTASSAGLGRVASLIAETASRGVLGAGQQSPEQPRQIPVVEQQPEQQSLEQRQQQQQTHAEEQCGPRQIPVIEMVAPAQQQQGVHAQALAAQQQSSAAAGAALALKGANQQAEALSEALPAADAAGLEGFFSEAAEAEAAAAGTGAAAAAGAELAGPAGAKEQLDQQQVAYATVLPSAGTDAQLAESAVAQQAAAASQAAPAGPLLGAGNGAAGSPEHLYPPGRIIWLFPAEESFVEEAESAMQAMDTAWQGAAEPPEEAEQQGTQPAQQAKQQSAQQASQHSEVDMQEAAAAVETGGGHSAAETGAARRQTVVCEAARVPFERILLMPDCLNDHLPDKYLNALQQL